MPIVVARKQESDPGWLICLQTTSPQPFPLLITAVWATAYVDEEPLIGLFVLEQYGFVL